MYVSVSEGITLELFPIPSLLVHLWWDGHSNHLWLPLVMTNGYSLSFIPIGVVLGFEQTIFTIDEEDGFVELCVNVTEPPPSIAIVNISLIAHTQDGTAGTTVELIHQDFVALLLQLLVTVLHYTCTVISFSYPVSPGDYVAVNEPFRGYSFNTDNRRQCFNVTIENDDIPEDAESFTITIRHSVPSPLVIVAPVVATITILDSDRE